MITLLPLLQWPAMVASVAAAWLVAAQSMHRRKLGFWCFIASNILWTAWGINERAWAIVVLQAGLGVLNVRGAQNNPA